MGRAGMGAGIDFNSMFAQISQAIGAAANAPGISSQPSVQAQPLTLDALLYPVVTSPAGAAFVDKTLNAILDNPQTADYLTQRAIAIAWDKYKFHVILGALAVVGLAFYIGRQTGQGGKNE